MPVSERGKLRGALLRWYRREQRDLPWRRTRDPYRIWISEAMLQQTRVETVIPYYQRFLKRFPTAQALADADLEEVLGEWAGLGYYSRARNLHRAASVVRDRHDGKLPDSAAALRELPGVGRYTAGAIASIAFDRAEPIVDGNVARVLSRIHGLRDDVKGKAGQQWLWEEAEALVHGRDPGALNQALMELGATVCTPRSPICDACPVQKHCVASAQGKPEAYPISAPRPKPKEVEAVAAFVTRRGQALAVRRPPKGLLGGLWELPGDELAGSERPSRALHRALRERVGIEVETGRRLGSIEHVFTHRKLRLHVYRCAAKRGGRVRLDGFDAHRWLAPSSLSQLPSSGVMRKALDLVFERQPVASR